MIQQLEAQVLVMLSAHLCKIWADEAILLLTVLLNSLSEHSGHYQLQFRITKCRVKRDLGECMDSDSSASTHQPHQPPGLTENKYKAQLPPSPPLTYFLSLVLSTALQPRWPPCSPHGGPHFPFLRSLPRWPDLSRLPWAGPQHPPS